MKLKSRTFGWLAFSSLAFMGCTATQMTDSNRSYSHLLTVQLKKTDTIQAIEQNYAGQVMLWSDGDYAVLGFAQKPVQSNLSLAAVSRLESNTKVFKASASIVRNAGLSTLWAEGLSTLWAEGLSTLWAEGLSTLWAEGLSTLWAEGTYKWMPENTNTWNQIRLFQAHSLAKNLGYGVKVAIIDTGVDLNHPALTQGLAPSNEWKDFVDNDLIPQEKGTLGTGAYGHGTSVAGIVRQIAPRAVILPIRVLDSNGAGTPLNVAAGINWAVAKGAKIINLSLGAAVQSSAIDAALKTATDAGVLVVSSVGNANSTAITYPAASATMASKNFLRLSVTSVNKNDLKSDFANYGTATEIAAPGELVYGPAPENRMAAWTGTSMAAPVAAGGLALALGQELVVPAKDLVNQLIIRSADLYNNGSNQAYKDQLGKGRIQLEEFLKNTIRY